MYTRAFLRAPVNREPRPVRREKVVVPSPVLQAAQQVSEEALPPAPAVEVAPVAAVEAAPAEPVVEAAPAEPVVEAAPVEPVVEVSPLEALLLKGQSEVITELGTGAWDSEVQGLLDLEKANKNRKKVLAALESRKTPVLPTFVGVNRRKVGTSLSMRRPPHVRGGEPSTGLKIGTPQQSSPRSWG